jgi:hypothetical protein
MRKPARIVLAVVGLLGVVAFFYLLVLPRITGAWAAPRAREDLLKVPVYVELQKHEPAVFEKLVARYALVLRGKLAAATYTDDANAAISTVATQRIAHASDAALLALMQDMLDKLRLLRARSPDDCYRYLFPKVAGPPDLKRWFDAASQARTLGLMADVIRTSAENPVEVPARFRVEPLLGPVINDIYAQFGENTQLISRADEPGVNRSTVCAVSVTLYEKVMKLPPADAAAVIRTMTQM